MRFVGFDFVGVTPPVILAFSPPGWSDRLTVTAARSTAQARGPLLPPDGPAVKQLTPIALQFTCPGLAQLSTAEVVNALVSEAGDAVTKTTTAAELPDILSQRANVLTYGGMGEAICAGFMIAGFSYEFTPPPTTPPTTAADYELRRQSIAHDAVVATGYNMAKRKVGQAKQPMFHTKQKGDKLNHDQVHTEQVCCKQLDAFLDFLESNAGAAQVVNVHERWQFKKDGFDLKKMSIRVKIVFEHVDKNVTADCDACSKTIGELTTKWAAKCRSITVAVSKNS